MKTSLAGSSFCSVHSLYSYYLKDLKRSSFRKIYHFQLLWTVVKMLPVGRYRRVELEEVRMITGYTRRKCLHHVKQISIICYTNNTSRKQKVIFFGMSLFETGVNKSPVDTLIKRSCLNISNQLT